MIRRLRRRHRVTFLVLGVALPVAFVAAILERDPVPATAEVPEALSPQLTDEELGRIQWVRSGPLWDELRIEIGRAAPRDGVPRIAVRPTRDLGAPEVLFYWAPGLTRTPVLPDKARLLGTLAGTHPGVFPLPLAMRAQAGRFFVYSLAHQKVLAESPTGASAAGG